MERTIITDVKQYNYREVLARLQELGVRWQGGSKPLDFLHFSNTYGVGLHFPNTMVYNVDPSGYLNVKKISARDFLKRFKPDEIVITRKERKVTATDQNGNHASARCCPEDDFDFYEGAKLALERLEEKTREIKAGDHVRIKNPGKTFSTLPAAYFTTQDEIRRYVFGEEPRLGIIYRVKRVGHDGKLYIDHGSDYSGLFVIERDGVERI